MDMGVCRELLRTEVSLRDTPDDPRSLLSAFRLPRLFLFPKCWWQGGAPSAPRLSTPAEAATGARRPVGAGRRELPSAALISRSALTKPDQRGLEARAGSGPRGSRSSSREEPAGRCRIPALPRGGAAPAPLGWARRSPLGAIAGASGEAGPAPGRRRGNTCIWGGGEYLDRGGGRWRCFPPYR